MNGHTTGAVEPTGWTGWTIFAAFMLLLNGVFQIIFGLTAIFNDKYFVVTQGQLLWFDLTTWGWIQLLAGVVLLLAGLSLMAGGGFGRVIGVMAAFLSAIANIATISASPVWSVVMISVDVLVIYALTAHGDELKSLRG